MRLSNYLKQHPTIQNHLLNLNIKEELEVWTIIGQWINDGLVSIDGQITLTHARVNPNVSVVSINLDNQIIQLPYTNPKLEYILFYKPVGYLCTHKDPIKRPIVYDLLPSQYQDFNSAGRLDQNSEGLIVFSNDGYFLHRLMSPEIPCDKVYLVGLKQHLSQGFVELAFSGEFIIHQQNNGGDIIGQQLLPVKVEILGKNNFGYLKLESDLIWYQFTLNEGRNNQIRKMCASFDNPVQRLIRIQQGQFRLTKEIMNQSITTIGQKLNSLFG